MRVSVLPILAKIADDNDIAGPSYADRRSSRGSVEHDRNLQENEARNQARKGATAHLRTLLPTNSVHRRAPNF